MESNPYAPPKAEVADHEPDAHGLKFRSVWLVFAFLLCTLGLYYIIWFFRRRAGLNRLDSDRKLPLWPLLLVVALYVVQIVLGVLSAGEPLPLVIGETANGALVTAQFVIGLGMVFYCFRIKFIIEDHAAGPGNERYDQLSGLMTFFFSILYLQWAINRYVVGGSRG